MGTLGCVLTGPAVCPGSPWPCGSIPKRAALGDVLCPLCRKVAVCAHGQIMPRTLVLYKRRRGLWCSDLQD